MAVAAGVAGCVAAVLAVGALVGEAGAVGAPVAPEVGVAAGAMLAHAAITTAVAARASDRSIGR